MAVSTNHIGITTRVVVEQVADSDLISYLNKRKSFYAEFADRWPGTLLDPYDILELLPLPATEIAAITQAAAGISRIYQRTATLLQTVSDDTLLQMGLPPATLHLSRLRIEGMRNCVIGRLDLVKVNDHYKLLEFNADTPGMVIETFPINAKVCEVAKQVDPNDEGKFAIATALESAIRAGLLYVGKSPDQPAQVVFTAHSTFERDKDVTNYLMNSIDLPEHVQKQCVSLEQLRADENGLYEPDGKVIDVLYRFQPLQFLCGSLFDLVLRRKLAIINPPGAFLLSNKAVQAIVWNLFELGQYFTAEEQSLIEEHFLPTYMDPVFSDRHVVKPVYGDDGDSITIMDGQQRVSRSNTSTYMDQPMVYQKYVELPQVHLMTENGMQSLSMLTSCFLIDEKPVGICLRAGESITGFNWWYLPVCVV